MLDPMRSCLLGLVCPIVLACTDTSSSERAPAPVIAEPVPEYAPAPAPAPMITEPAATVVIAEPVEAVPVPLELELIALRDGPIDLLTTDGELFVRIESELLHVDDRGRPIYTPDARDPAWSWKPLRKRGSYDDGSRGAERVDAFGGPADRPILSLASHMARFDSIYRVYQLGGSSAEQLKIKHDTLQGFYTEVARWGDGVVGLPAWIPDDDYYEQFSEYHEPTPKQLKAWAAADQSLLTAARGIVSISPTGAAPPPDLLGLVPMALASDAEGNLHAIAHTLAPDFDPVAVMEEHDITHFAFNPHINVGLLGGLVEEYSVHEYVHLRWRPGELKPERHPLPGLEQAQVEDMFLNASATMTLAVRTAEERPWLGVLEGDRWRTLPNEQDFESMIADLTIDARGQARMPTFTGVWRLPSQAAQWIHQPLPETPISPSDIESSVSGPELRSLEVRDWSDLTVVHLAWARGRSWLVAQVGSEEVHLLFRIIDDAAAPRDTSLAPIELPGDP